MSDTKKKAETETRKPIQTFRAGAVGASVWCRQSATGYYYLDYSLSRSYKSMSSGKEGYSSNFFDRNREELHKVIDECCDYIEEKLANAETVSLQKTESEPARRKAA